MKEPYEKGLANQFGLESCAGFREETVEALTEVNPGQPLSSENITLCVPTLSCQGEGHTGRSVQREFLLDATESQTLRMDSTLTSRKPGDLGGSRRLAAGGTVGKGVMPCVRHARRRGVG